MTVRGAHRTIAPGSTAAVRHPRDISDEPMINFLHRRTLEIALLTYALSVVYLSLVPFDFLSARDGRARLSGHIGLPLGPANGPDIVTNLAIYAPLGMLATLALRRRRVRGLWCYPIVAGAALCLSIGIEYAQCFVASRVSSWIDVVGNVFGAVFGAAWAGFAEVLLSRPASSHPDFARKRWSMAVARAAVIAVLIIHLRPYDIAADVLHTAAQSARSPDVHPLAAWNAMPDQVAREVRGARRTGMHELARVRQEYVLDRMVDVAVYSALFVIVAAALRRARWKGGVALGRAGLAVVSVAAIVTASRVLLVSHGLDTAHLLCGLVAVPIGCGAAWMIDWRAKRLDGWSGEPPDSLRAWAAWRPAALACAATVMLSEMIPFDLFGTSGSVAAAINWTPLRAHFQSRPNIALYDITGDILRYAGLAASFAVFFHARTSRAWRGRLVLCVAATCATATSAMFAHASMPSRTADVTSVLLAAIGGFLGVVALRWIADVRRTYFASDIDDPLTAALIEGQTYQSLSYISPRRRRDGASLMDPARSGPRDGGGP
jgi:VanZ family protein